MLAVWQCCAPSASSQPAVLRSCSCFVTLCGHVYCILLLAASAAQAKQHWGRQGMAAARLSRLRLQRVWALWMPAGGLARPTSAPSRECCGGHIPVCTESVAETLSLGVVLGVLTSFSSDYGYTCRRAWRLYVVCARVALEAICTNSQPFGAACTAWSRVLRSGFQLCP